MKEFTAPFNLLANAKEQWAQAQQFMAEVFMDLGKADATVHEPGDTDCREPLLAALRNVGRAERCLARHRASLEKLLAMRPERAEAGYELTPAGRDAIAMAARGGPKPGLRVIEGRGPHLPGALDYAPDDDPSAA